MQETPASEGRILLFVRLFLCFLVSRALFALPLFLPLGFLSFWPRVAVKLTLCLIVAVLICGPERLLRASALSEKSGSGSDLRLSYPVMVKKTVLRLLRVFPFAVLFLIPSVLAYYSIYDDEMNFKAMRTLKNIGDPLKNLFFPSSQRVPYDFGCGALLIGAAVFLIAAAILWHRDVPMDYGKEIRAYYRNHSAVWRRTSLINLLLGFPAYILWGLTLALSYRSLSSGSYRGLLDFMMTSRKPIGAMMRNRELFVYLVLILLLVYLPCWCLRKWRLTRACAEGSIHAA